jgi:hypothetical protein
MGKVVNMLFMAFGRIDEIEWGITPEQWLDSHWYVRWNDWILAEPSSTFFVFLLGFVILVLSIRFLRSTNQQKSRFWFGLSMLAWSISTFSAGVSYQILSYQLKCAGRDVCLWTTSWEIVYLLLYVISVKFLVVAVGYSRANGKTRKLMFLYALVTGIVYTAILMAGVLMPNQFLISFELMVMFLVPSYVIMFLISVRNIRKSGDLTDRYLIQAWIGMLVITVAYFMFYLSGISAVLWDYGIWFNANDVLHLLLIGWVLYVNRRIFPLISDHK